MLTPRILSCLFYIKTLNFSTCIEDPEYSQYDCYNEKLNERLRRELKCLRPFQVHNKLNVGLSACKNQTQLDGKCDTLCFKMNYIIAFHIHTGL